MQRHAEQHLGIQTYTMHDLCARYHGCAPSTIYRRMKGEDYPRPARIGKENLWNARAVYEWERSHMPELHNVKVTAVEADEGDAAVWNRIRETKTDGLAQLRQSQAERRADDQRWRRLRAKVKGAPRVRRRAG